MLIWLLFIRSIFVCGVCGGGCVQVTLTNLPKWPPVDVAFNEISFSVSEGRRKGYKTILKGVSGLFRSGELTAIMGPSKQTNHL